jgi:hypothetical protein
MIVFLYYKNYIFDKNTAEGGGGLNPQNPLGYPTGNYYFNFCFFFFLFCGFFCLYVCGVFGGGGGVGV